MKGADAKSVKWELKYKDPATGEEGQETVEQTAAQLRNGLGEYEFLPLKYEFKHAGEYEISEVVQGDDLAEETVKAAEVLHVEATATTPILKPAPPKAVRVNEEEATLSVEGRRSKHRRKTQDASEEDQVGIRRWHFSGSHASGGTGGRERTADQTQVHVSRCKAGKCKVTLIVEDTVAEGTPAKTTFEITVNESVAEEELHKKEAEEKPRKKLKKRKEKQEAEGKAAKEAQEAKERQAAAEKAAKEAQEAKAAKEAKEKAEQKKREEEAAHKAPTRAQLLAKALKTCKKESKSKRAKCEATARKKYGPKGKKKRKKKK